MAHRISAGQWAKWLLNSLLLLVAIPSFAGDNPEVSRLIQQLQSSVGADHYEALSRLAEMGPAGQDAIPTLAQLVSDSDVRVRRQALQALKQIAPNAKPSVEAFIRALKDDDVSIRLASIAVLEKIDPTTKEISDALVVALKDSNPDVRRKVAYAIGKLKPCPPTATKPLLETLQDNSDSVRVPAAMALGCIRPVQKDVISALLAVLKEPNGGARSGAMAAFAQIGEAGNAASPFIAEALLDKSLGIRLAAVGAIGRVGPPHAKSLPILIKALNDEEAGIRQSVAETVGLMGPAGLPAASKLAELFGDKYPTVQERALGALRRMGPGSIPFLIQALEHPKFDPELKRRAIDALGDMGPAAKSAIPQLVNVVRLGPGTLEGQRATQALQKMGPEAAEAFLVMSQDKALWHNAVLSLAKMGESAVPTLLVTLRSTDDGKRAVAADALSQMKQVDTRHIPKLVKCLEDPKTEVRLKIAETLANMGPRAKSAQQALLKLSKDDSDYYVQTAAAKALEGMGVSSIAGIRANLKSDKFLVRMQAADSLGKMGDKAKLAIPDLILALQDENVNVRVHAAYALGRIGKAAEKAVPALIKHWDEGQKDQRYYVIPVLGDIGVQSTDTVRVIREALKNPNSGYQIAAAESLQKLGLLGDPEIPTLIALLDVEERRIDPVGPSIRVRTLTLLKSMGIKAKPAIPKLVGLLDNEGYGVRNTVSETLRAIGASSDGLPPLILGLANEKQAMRESAAEAIGNLGPGAAEAVPALMWALRDKEPYVREKAAIALWKIGPAASEAIPELQNAARDDIEYVLRQVRTAIQQIGGPEVRQSGEQQKHRTAAEHDIGSLISKLKNGEDIGRWRAAIALGRAGTAGKEAVPQLIEALSNPRIRSGVGYALVALGPDVVPALIKTLRTAEPTTRDGIVEVLRRIEAPAVSALIEAIKAGDAAHRQVLADALAQIGRFHVETIINAVGTAAGPARDSLIKAIEAQKFAAYRPLVMALRSKDQRVREGAVLAIGQIGAPVAYDLAYSLWADEPEVRDAAKRAFARMPPGAASELAAKLNDPNPHYRAQLIGALGAIGAAARPAVPQLIASLQDGDRDVRCASAYSLLQMRQETALATRALVENLLTDYPHYCARALKALGWLDQGYEFKGKQVLAALLEMLGDKNQKTRTLAAHGLKEMRPSSEQAVRALLEIIRDEDGPLRAKSFEVLAEMGRPVAFTLVKYFGSSDERLERAALAALTELGTASVPALEAASKHEKVRVRQNAVVALGQIGERLASKGPNIGGVGMRLQARDDKVLVDEVMRGMPAERVGLEKGDQIVAIDGETIAGLSMEEVIQRIRGHRGKPVDLRIKRGPSGQLHDFRIVREMLVVGTDEIMKLLQQASKDTDKAVREAASEALEKIRTPEPQKK